MLNPTQQSFHDAIPLFSDLPKKIFTSLDLSHFYLPSETVADLRRALEELLGHYVVTYKANVFRLDIPVETHLCGLVKGANLTPDQQDLLKKYEKMLRPLGVTLVVFKKPLVLISIEQSAVYKKYKEMNLL